MARKRKIPSEDAGAIVKRRLCGTQTAAPAQNDRLSEMDIDTSSTPDMEKNDSFIKCHVHWGKKTFDVEVDLEEPIMVFKAQLFALTQVDPERQKIIYNGRVSREDNWVPRTLKDGDHVVMVGTNDVVVIPESTEDTKVSQTTKMTIRLPPIGIKNLGNTCFMNSVLQVLRTIPELKEAILKFNQDSDNNQKDLSQCVVIRSISELFKALEQRADTYETNMNQFLTNIEGLFPEYTGSIEKGGRRQQDANEFFMRLIDIFKKHLVYQPNQYVKGRSLIETLFGIDVEKEYKCLEPAGESATTVNETELQLSVYITNETKFMIDGIKSKFNEIITKHSSLLNADASFSVNTTITRLPAYLSVQYVRFFFKEQEKINAKIMKDVKFPIRLDMTELCSPTLKERFRIMMPHVREFENKLSIAETEASQRSLRKRQDAGVISTTEQKLGPGDCGSGIYELVAVLTHEGRTTSSGHYVAWVRFDHTKWIKMDDEIVSYVEESDVLKLSGGGEAHSAYLLVYQALKIPKI